MRSVFKCVKGFDGDNIILNARVEYKRFEDIKDFKKRVKKHKYYSEDYILEDLYTYMSYSNDLLNLIDKQQKLINIFIHNEAVREGKNFNGIKEKYYECL